ncbi:MAG: MMPL family transporter [Gillisia sp.]
MNFLRSIIYPHRYLIFFIFLLSCIFLWPGVKKAIEVDNSLSVWFLEDDPALVEYREYKERFGNDESVIILIKDPETVLSKQHFSSFINITNSLESIPEVDAVLGPGNVQVPVKTLLGPGGRNLIDKNSNPDKVLSDLENNPYINNQFFTRDHKAARFIVVFKSIEDFDEKRDELILEIRERVAEEFPADTSFIGGIGVIFSGLNQISTADFGFFLGLAYLLMFLLILVIYRSFYVLAFTFSTIAFATYVTLGIYGLMGHQLNLMTTLIPTILVLLGILDVIHILNQRTIPTGEIDAKTDTLLSIKKVFRPCLYTSLTTMAGFLSLLSSPMAILRDFGIYSALGIFLCLFFSFFFALIFLPLIKSKRAIGSSFQLLKLHKFVLTRKPLFFGLSFILIILFTAGLFKLKNDTYTLGYFPKNHEVVLDHQEMEHTWGAYIPFDLVIDPEEGYQLHSPEIVQAGLAFSDSIKNIPGIGSSFGFPDLYYAGLQNSYGQNADKMLERRSGLSQTNKFLQMQYPKLSGYYIHKVSGTGRISVFGEMSSALALTQKKEALMEMGKSLFGDYAKITPAGYLPMYSEIVNYAAQSQINSLVLAFALVFLLVWLFIGSFKMAGLAIVPNLFPVLLILGVMGWFNIDLDIATASISAIALSFCIDDTLHFMYHYKRHRDAGETPEASRILSLNRVGKAIVLTSLILLAGFSLMLFASLKTVFLFGLLTAIAILGALFSHLILLPLLLEKFDQPDTIKS